MIRELQTVDEVVTELGGNSAVQKMTRTKHSSAISNWKDVGQFPPKTYKVMQDALEARGLRAPAELWGMVHG